MRIENWCGHDIRVVEVNGEWYAILKDICDALNLRSKDVSQRLDSNMMERVIVKSSEDGLNDFRSRGENKTRWMLAINEIGIYEALFASRRLEARKFRRWSSEIIQKLRSKIGLEGYEIMRMTEPDIQAKVDWIIDGLFYDDKKKMVMQSVTVPGGDVDQVSFL